MAGLYRKDLNFLLMIHSIVPARRQLSLKLSLSMLMISMAGIITEIK